MNSPLHQLAARIQADLTEIERALQRLEEGWRRYQHSADNLDPAKVEYLVRQASARFAQFRMELSAFADFLDQQP